MKKRIYTEKHINELIENGTIHNNLTALEHSVKKHKEVDERNKHSYDRVHHSQGNTCPICAWAQKKIENENGRRRLNNSLTGVKCELAGSNRGRCNDGPNCCNGLWNKYMNTPKNISESHLEMTKFIEKRYNQLKKKRDNDKWRKR